MDIFINYLKINLNLNGFKIIKTSYNTVLIFKSFSKYSKCIYLNFINDYVEINIDKVFDSKEFYIGIERLIISKTIYKNFYDSFNYIQKKLY